MADPDRFQLSDKALAGAILVWTALSWGGRVNLLTGPESDDVWTWVRVGGSILLGLAAAHVLWRGGPFRRNVLLLFVLWTVVLWGRALALAWTDSSSVGFSVVHTVLALGWALLATMVGRLVYRPVEEGVRG
ncbi:MAG: hypothetical protein GEU79_18290 [Acidimicrobiia bacterium]|nr:hypothetical protein [Acidimicrobiia bacterium]